MKNGGIKFYKQYADYKSSIGEGIPVAYMMMLEDYTEWLESEYAKTHTQVIENINE
jgi:hypothetical protein